jgi:hypothetical protein
VTSPSARANLLVAALLLAGFAGWTAWGALTTEGFLEADEVNHWLHARHAPQHPTNLLQPWGRPLYTLLLLPLSQLGLPASRLLAVLSAAVAAACAALAARALGWRCWPCAIPAAYAQPLFFQQTYGIWTEVTFAALLGAWMLALAKERPWVLAAIAAALPLVRPEGFVVVAATALVPFSRALAPDVAWRPARLAPLVLLPCGVLLWWAVALAASGDPRWLFEHWPKDWSAGASYGRGSWTWVFGALLEVVPATLVPALVLGCFAPAMRRGSTPALRSAQVGGPAGWPVALVVVLVMGLHAVLWGAGAYGSAGYARYFVSLAPAFALLIAGGIEVVARLVPRVPPGAWAVAAAAVAVVLLLRHPTATVRPPMPPDGKLFSALGAWLTRQEADPVLHSSHPFAYLELPSVPRERFDDFGFVRRETLRDAAPGTWVLVEDRLYLKTVRGTRGSPHGNPDEPELSALGYSKVEVPDLGAALRVADPRHDPAIAGMHWALYRKVPR